MSRQAATGRGRRALRFVLLAASFGLLLLCMGCHPLFVDILYGDGCGDHDVCESKAARAGAVAGAAALTGAVLQNKRAEQDSSGEGEPEPDNAGDGGGSVDSSAEPPLDTRPSPDHVWDPAGKQWVLPAEKQREQEMKRKGYEFDESYGDGGAWRKKVDDVKPVEIPREKGDVTLPEYKPGVISSQAEASYQNLEDRLNQLNEMEEKAIDDYKRLREAIREAEEAGDNWLAEKLRNNIEMAKDNVDTIQEAKADVAKRHEYHSDEQFKKRYDKGWTAGAVAKELLLDPFTHMIAPDMSDTVDVMANAIAARNRLQSQIGRQDSKLFGEHDQAMKELRDVIKARSDALERGDTGEAARLKEQGDAIKGRLNDLANRMDAVQKDVKDWEQKSLKAGVEAGAVATDRVGSGRGAYETGKFVAKKLGLQSERPEIKARKPTLEDQGTQAESKGGSGGDVKAESRGDGGSGSRGAAKAESKGAAKAEAKGAAKGEGGAEATGSSRAEGSGGGGGTSSGEGGTPKGKTYREVVRDVRETARQRTHSAEVKGQMEREWQETAAEARARGITVDESIRGHQLAGTQQDWIARDQRLGINPGSSVKGWDELAGIEPNPQVKAMLRADTNLRNIDRRIRACWRKADPGVGPGFKPDYYDQFVKNMQTARISEAEYTNWLKAINTGQRYDDPMGTVHR